MYGAHRDLHLLTLPFPTRRSSDLTVTPHIYSDTLPMAEVNYQSLLPKGAYQVTGYVTYGSRIPTSSGPGASEKDIRGYIDASGKFQFNPYWNVSGSIRAATDRTFQIGRENV